MRYSRNSKVRKVNVTHDNRALRTVELLTVSNQSLTFSKAGLSELSVEQNAKRRFAETIEDFNERVLESRFYTRKATEQSESRY